MPCVCDFVQPFHLFFFRVSDPWYPGVFNIRLTGKSIFLQPALSLEIKEQGAGDDDEHGPEKKVAVFVVQFR